MCMHGVFRDTCSLSSLQFAIRPTLRNHNTLTRDGIIKQIAAAVGTGHKVDLTGYDLLVLVEVYKVGHPPHLFLYVEAPRTRFVSPFCIADLGPVDMQNVCGMSVVSCDYDKLKRYNLAEIYEPTPKPQIN